jgi:HTH-type transcriptional regulator / antitoxin HigA
MQLDELIPAYTPSPGEILAAELATRGWSQRHFGTIIGRPAQAVNEILRAKKQITPETALRIAAALDTSAELWINLETDYRLALARQSIPPQLLRDIAQRSGHSALVLA